MKKLPLLLLLFLSFNVAANELTFDPTLPGEKTLTITCDFALTRTDGSTIAIGDIAKASYYVDKGDGSGFINTNADTPVCKQTFDMTTVPDGVYVYKVTETDTDGRESALSAGLVKATVKRVKNPNSPTGVLGTKS